MVNLLLKLQIVTKADLKRLRKRVKRKKFKLQNLNKARENQMITKKPLRGHRRTMSSTEVEINTYISTAPSPSALDEFDEGPKTHRQRLQVVTQANNDFQHLTEQNQSITTLVKASCQNTNPKTIVVEELQTQVQYQDPLFHFGKTKKLPTSSIFNTPEPKQPLINRCSQREKPGLFMIPEMNFKQTLKKKSESSRLTKVSDGSMTKETQKRVNNLMSKGAIPSEGIFANQAVAGRLKVNKKYGAKKHELFLARKTKLRISLADLDYQ